MKNAVEKTKVLLSGWCCDELKEAAQNWLDSIGIDKEKEFGEETAKKFYEHAKDLKAQGIANCDCPACTAASAVLELKDEILK